jgi:hypothetical protein
MRATLPEPCRPGSFVPHYVQSFWIGAVGFDPARAEQAEPGRQVREQVHIAVRVVVAAGNAAEHLEVADAMSRCGGDQVLPVAPQPTAQRA